MAIDVSVIDGIKIIKSNGVDSNADFMKWCRFWKERLIEDVELEWLRGAEQGPYDEAEDLVLRAGLIALQMEEPNIAAKCFARRYSPLNSAVLFAEILRELSDNAATEILHPPVGFFTGRDS